MNEVSIYRFPFNEKCFQKLASFPAINRIHLDREYSEKGLWQFLKVHPDCEVVFGEKALKHQQSLLPAADWSRDQVIQWLKSVGEGTDITFQKGEKLVTVNRSESLPSGDLGTVVGLKFKVSADEISENIHQLRILREVNSLNAIHLRLDVATMPDLLRIFPKLEVLSLRSTKANQDAAVCLQFPSIHTIQAQYSSFSDYGLQLLARKRNLRRLQLRDTSVTRAGVENFRRMQPDCELDMEPEPQESPLRRWPIDPSDPAKVRKLHEMLKHYLNHYVFRVAENLQYTIGPDDVIPDFPGTVVAINVRKSDNSELYDFALTFPELESLDYAGKPSLLERKLKLGTSFDLVVPGSSVRSRASLKKDQLIIVNQQQETVYDRDARFDTPEYLGFYSHATKQALRIPLSGKGNLEIGRHENSPPGQIRASDVTFKPSQMVIEKTN